MLLRRAWIAIVLLVIACGSTTTPDATPIDGGGDVGAPLEAGTDAGTDSGNADVGLDANDASDTSVADADASSDCKVEPGCTNPSTPNVPAERSGELLASCAGTSDCTTFCRAQNPGFAGQTTCVKSVDQTTFHCRCVNP